jgi:UDP-N-acetylmuramyl pentapeptide phosphotransferase/UDP-N-acetylglucosamine-1-phosphate transferase
MLAAAPLMSGAFVLLVTLYVTGLQCDESCTGEDWRHTAGAWQWSLYPVLGGMMFVAGLMTFVFVCRNRPGGAFGALVLGTLVFFSGLAWSGDNWRESLGRNPLVVGLIAVIVISGVLAALLSAPTQTEGSGPAVRDEDL